jgi:hypothetical protein
MRPDVTQITLLCEEHQAEGVLYRFARAGVHRKMLSFGRGILVIC